MKKTHLKRFSAAGLAAIVAMSSVIWAAETEKIAADDDPLTETETQEAIENEYPQLLVAKSSNDSNSKDETVYVSADASGKIKNVTVTEWLQNREASEKIKDVSSLTDIENTANNSEYTQDGNSMVWAADGADIKYKGKTDSELPVSVNITYYLDGKQMSAEEMAGKEGNIRIVFDYDVHTSASAGGYNFGTPYTMASGVILDDKHFTNIKIDGGKAIDEGSNCICLGLAFPGMRDNLGIDTSSLDIPEKVTIEAYTDSFAIDGTYTVALSGILGDLDLSGTDEATDKVAELTDALNEMGKAADKLVSGAEKVSDGADTVSEKSSEIADGAGELADGTSELKSGAAAVAEGAKQILDATASALSGINELKKGTEQLKAGSAALSSGIDQLTAGSSSLKDGTSDLYSGLKKIDAGFDGVTDEDGNHTPGIVEGSAAIKAGLEGTGEGENYQPGFNYLYSNLVDAANGIDGGLAQLKESGSGLSAGADSLNEGIDAILSNEELALTEEQKAALSGALKSAVGSYTDSVKEYTGAVGGLYDKENEAKTKLVDPGQSALNQITAGVDSLDAGINQLSAGVDSAVDGAGKVNSGAKQVYGGLAGENGAQNGAKSLASGSAAADEGVGKLQSGAGALNQGASDLNDGAGLVSGGADAVNSGAGKLAKGTKKFEAGTEELADGARQLYEGMNAFNEDGVEKLISTLDDADIEGTFDRLKALVDACGQVDLIGGIADGMSGSSKIIIKTASIKADETQP